MIQIIRLFVLLLALTFEAKADPIKEYLSWGHHLNDSISNLNVQYNQEIQAALKKVNGKRRSPSCPKLINKFSLHFTKGFKAKYHNFNILKKDPKIQYFPNKNSPQFKAELDGEGRFLGLYKHEEMDPVIHANGVYFGVDKLGHFFGLGILYNLVKRVSGPIYRLKLKYKSFKLRRKIYKLLYAELKNEFSRREAKRMAKAKAKEIAKKLTDKMVETRTNKASIEFGLFSEQTFIGKFGGYVSFADYEANYQGSRFYNNICTGSNPFLVQKEVSYRNRRGQSRIKKQWVQVRKIDFKDYINPQWDETFFLGEYGKKNWAKTVPSFKKMCPSRYTSRVYNQIQNRFYGYELANEAYFKDPVKSYAVQNFLQKVESGKISRDLSKTLFNVCKSIQ